MFNFAFLRPALLTGAALLAVAFAAPSDRASAQSPATSAPGAVMPSPDQNAPQPHVELPKADASYQTMCVRTCDGFYFPLRQNALPQNFAKDEPACTATCGSGARLFYLPLGGPPESMIDLKGRKYTDEPHAFLFRKALVPGCTCKPAPWSKEAAERHREYEKTAIEERQKAKALAAQRVANEAERTSAAISAEAARDYDQRRESLPVTPVLSVEQKPEPDPEPDSALEQPRPLWQRPTFRMPGLRYNSW